MKFSSKKKYDAKSDVSYQQRQDAEYYFRSRLGYDSTTGEKDKGVLQRYAAKHSAATRMALFRIIDDNTEKGND